MTRRGYWLRLAAALRVVADGAAGVREPRRPVPWRPFQDATILPISPDTR